MSKKEKTEQTIKFVIGKEIYDYLQFIKKIPRFISPSNVYFEYNKKYLSIKTICGDSYCIKNIDIEVDTKEKFILALDYDMLNRLVTSSKGNDFKFELSLNNNYINNIKFSYGNVKGTVVGIKPIEEELEQFNYILNLNIDKTINIKKAELDFMSSRGLVYSQTLTSSKEVMLTYHKDSDGLTIGSDDKVLITMYHTDTYKSKKPIDLIFPISYFSLLSNISDKLADNTNVQLKYTENNINIITFDEKDLGLFVSLPQIQMETNYEAYKNFKEQKTIPFCTNVNVDSFINTVTNANILSNTDIIDISFTKGKGILATLKNDYGEIKSKYEDTKYKEKEDNDKKDKNKDTKNKDKEQKNINILKSVDLQIYTSLISTLLNCLKDEKYIGINYIAKNRENTPIVVSAYNKEKNYHYFVSSVSLSLKVDD